ncbi:hypothetical protein LCGC14_2013720 [marine sediment metagenome]|uniref:HNH nuclease domain-containing protein n=1 Tax=marine sediment metagenome TaxID=412755 RepID=A0A0F9HCZ8_9ZZZZ
MSFWEHVEKTSTCWLWTGHIKSNGYGGYGPETVHRKVYKELVGEIPKGMLVCHHCDVKSCVRPNHLFLGTHKDNTQDAVKKGRMASGLRNGAYTHPEKRPHGKRHGRYTKPERTARGDRHGRSVCPEKSARGERVNTAKITWEDAKLIRILAKQGERGSEIAKKFGLCYSTVRRIVTGQYWKEEYSPLVV